MANTIKIVIDTIELTAELNNSATAQAIWNNLPLESDVHTWGEEIYCSIPVSIAESQDAREEMGIGEIAYWAPGNAFCIFFGRTPVSTSNKPRAASKVNPIGKINGNVSILKQVKAGAYMQLEKAD